MLISIVTMSEAACREIIERLLIISNPARRDVALIKMRVAREQSLKKMPSNPELVRQLRPNERDKLLNIIRRKDVRTMSGVTVIAVMTRPWPCPKESPCVYCPGGPTYGVPQSYTGNEPAAMRGIQSGFDPYRQVKSRVEQLEAIGHTVDKVEFIIMGGTFPSTPLNYQEFFIQRCLEAITKKKFKSLEEAKKTAERSQIRNVGITLETRPDWAKERHVNNILSMGVTRVELGVQNIYDDVYELVNRGHNVQDVVDSTRVLKDAGLKVGYHLMPGLPGSNLKRDFEAFETIFNNSSFKPDMIKIYPCLVLKGTRIYEWWKRGRYRPYTTEESVRLIAKVKGMVPPWVRIMRVQRDIPSNLIEAGVKQSNLRQLVLQRLKEQRQRCRCIRCREVGHRWLRGKIKPDPKNIRILTIREKASEGEEVFLSAEDPKNDILIGYLRLRIPSYKAHRSEILPGKTSIVRELHIYGPLVPVGRRMVKAWQHRGYGKILLTEAERTSREDYDLRKIVVMSGLGVKRYFGRFGYNHDGPYVSKVLKK